jgi:hypothetical protein
MKALTSDEPIRVQPSKLREVKPHELAVRFAFGAVISIVAATVGQRFGARLGGVFLAFPAILPASLTLVAKKDGKEAAEDDGRGAVLGAIGMVAFAAVASVGFHSLPVGAVLALATLAWAATGVGLYLVLRDVHRAEWRQDSGRSRSTDVVQRSSTSARGVTPMPGPAGTARRPPSSTNGSVTSSSK